jgi:hypothetical protein
MGFEILQDAVHFNQVAPSTSWVIVHDLNTKVPIVDCWIDNNGEQTKIIPSNVVGTDLNTCTITFTSARSGSAVVS